MKAIATILAAAAAALVLAVPAFADAFRGNDAFRGSDAYRHGDVYRAGDAFGRSDAYGRSSVRPNPWLTSGLRPAASTWNRAAS